MQFKVMLFFFVLGSMSCEWAIMQKTIIKVHILIFLGIFVGVYILYHTIDVSIISEVIILVLALLGIGITIEFSKIIEQTTKIRSILLYVAGCSYTIYLFHTTFEGFTKTILIKIIKGSLLDINHTTLFVFTTIVVVLSGIICPIIIHKIAKQNSKTLSYLIGEKHTGKVNDGFNKKSNENPSCQ